MHTIEQTGVTNARLYAKVMRHVEQSSGGSSWDFRTLSISRPKTAELLFKILTDELGDDSRVADMVMYNHYVPNRIWDWGLVFYPQHGEPIVLT